MDNMQASILGSGDVTMIYLFTGPWLSRATVARNRGFANRINLRARGKKGPTHPPSFFRVTKGLKHRNFHSVVSNLAPLFLFFFLFTHGNDLTFDTIIGLTTKISS